MHLKIWFSSIISSTATGKEGEHRGSKANFNITSNSLILKFNGYTTWAAPLSRETCHKIWRFIISPAKDS
jgi:hypothetical protein